MQKGSKYGEVPHGIVFTLRELVIVCVLISVVCKSNRCNLQTLGKDAFIVDALRVFSPALLPALDYATLHVQNSAK